MDNAEWIMDNASNGACEPDKQQSAYSIAQRTLAFGVRIVKATQAMQADQTSKVIARQLLRSGTSVGANVAEAQAAQSRKDFIAKVSIAHKEIHETQYWLRLITETGLLPETRLQPLSIEADELGRILTTIVKRAKAKQACHVPQDNPS